MKVTRQQINLVIFLSLIIILLFGGILYNQLVTPSSIITSTEQIQPPFLPSISTERRWGSDKDDVLVDYFVIENQTYVFYNSNDKGKMLIASDNETTMDVEGKIEFACIAYGGFAVALKRENGYALQLLDLHGAPTHSAPINYQNAKIQRFYFTGDTLTVGVQSKGVYDYIFSYLEFDRSLTLSYERIIYSVYNLSLVDCYNLANSVILFFNAEYGSVKKGCYATLDYGTKSVNTTYFPLDEGYVLLDVIPTEIGFSIACKSKSGSLFSLTLSYSFTLTVHSFENGVIDGAVLYGNGNSYYCYKYGNTHSLYSYDMICKKEITFARDAKILDCIFIDGSAVFAFCKNGKTYLYHTVSGISCVILDFEADNLKLKTGKKLTFITSTDRTTLSPSLGGKDVYMGILQ